MGRSARWFLATAVVLAASIGTLLLAKACAGLFGARGSDQWTVAGVMAAAVAGCGAAWTAWWADREQPPLPAGPGAATATGTGTGNGNGTGTGTYVPARNSVLPLQVGVCPRLAECFQPRSTGDDLRGAMADHDEAVGMSSILVGPGGVGKTQLAAHYAAEAWQGHHLDVLVWVVAGSRDAVQSAYAEAGAVLDAASIDDRQHAAEAFLRWLQTHPECRWLVVLDDVDSAEDLRGLWPPRTPAGRVLVTTRNRDTALLGDDRGWVRVDVFTESEACAYLAAKMSARGLHEPPDQLSGLAGDLGHLPLALAQAAAVIANRHLSCAAYRSRLADRRRHLRQLFPGRDGLPDEQRYVLAAVWSLSVEHADRLDPEGLARPLLNLAAMLDPNGIPASVLTNEAAIAYLRGQAHRDVDAEDVDDTLRNLYQLSLIDHNPGAPHRAVRVHNLIQRATRENLPAAARAVAARAAADALCASWPADDRGGDLAEILRANAAALVAAEPEALWEGAMHPVLLRATKSMIDATFYSTGITMLEPIVARATEQFGARDPAVLRGNHQLAQARGVLGGADAAVAAMEQLLADCEQVLGPEDVDTLETRADLIWFWWEQGHTLKAAHAYTQLLEDTTRALGPEHHLTLDVRHNLATCWGWAGFYDRALAAAEPLLAELVRTKGPEHPSTLAIRHNAAAWHGLTGEAQEAVDGLTDVVEARTRAQEAVHPETLAARRALAHWLDKAGRPREAVAAAEAVLDDDRRVLGADHPETLEARKVLAEAVGAAGDPQRAEATFGDLIEDYRRIQGPDHPGALGTRRSHAHWSGVSGHAEEAVTELTKLVLDYERVLGADDLETLRTRDRLAHWRGVAEGRQVAEADYRRLLSDYLTGFGPDHPETRAVQSKLAAWQSRAD